MPTLGHGIPFSWAESPVPAIGEIEHRHVEYQHRIVSAMMTRKHLPPAARGISARRFRF